MKILKLTAENFKKLSAVEITPDGNMVLITGKNAAGKSSVLDAIEAALCGGRTLPKQPIKTGEIRGKTETLLGDTAPEYKVTRKFFGTTSSLVVETTGENKSEIRSPQAFLDKIVGNISFDPLAFMRESPTEQRNTLMEFLGWDFDEFDNKIAVLKVQRSDVRKEKEKKLHEAESITITPNLPEVEQGADALLKELKEIQDHNEACQIVEREKAVNTQRLQTLSESIVAAEKAIKDWTARLAALQNQKAQIEREIAPHLEILYRDTAEVEQKIQNLSDTNEAIRRNIQRKQAIVDYDIHVAAYKDLGDQVKNTENQKARKMAEAVMPVRGLMIRSDGLAFEGIPLEQVNAAKKLEVCVAIAMALNPKLKVLRINGNDLDKDSLVTIAELIADKDYQVWVEKVSDDSKIGFYIEDGSLTNKMVLKKFTDVVAPLVTEGLPGAINEAHEN